MAQSHILPKGLFRELTILRQTHDIRLSGSSDISTTTDQRRIDFLLIFIFFFFLSYNKFPYIPHYDDVTMGTIASLITSLTIVYATVYADAYQRKHQSTASLAFVWGIHRRPGNSPHKWPVTRKMFPFDDVIMMQNP